MTMARSYPHRIPSYLVPIFVIFWILLFFGISRIQINSLPKPLTETDEANTKYNNAFIAQRAERILSDLTALGPKVLGTVQHEILAVQFLLKEINEIKSAASKIFQFDVDVQFATGTMKNVSSDLLPYYKNIKNIVVKIEHEMTNNKNYLLINSHFDTVPGSPGAGDAGSMVVVMLEVMRVITKSDQFIEHPIVFLFNGAEEAGLLGSHAFITQHKWAKNCKAVINLDAAGNGGREILFQSGPNNGWLLNYYASVPHPFGISLGEELFQAGLIPSDTDFCIFRDYGSIPGLDLAYIKNGYIYHTKYDESSLIDSAILQHTGNNILALTRGLANAPELNENVSTQQEPMIYFDCMGWFFVSYPKFYGTILNYGISAITLIAIIISMSLMHRQSGFGIKEYSCTAIIYLFSVVLAIILPLLVAYLLGALHLPMTWFSNTWLIIGLYFCPIVCGTMLLPAIYVSRRKALYMVWLVNTVQLFMHYYCILLLVITVILTVYGIRSAYLGTIAIAFHLLAVIISLMTRMNRNVFCYGLLITVCQIPSFLYFASLTELLYGFFIPIFGRAGPFTIPDFFIAGLAIVCVHLFAGFIIPLFLLFRKPIMTALTFGIICLVFIVLSFTSLGFPFKPQTAPERLEISYYNRVVRNAKDDIVISDSGILIDRMDDYMSKNGIMHYGELKTTTEICNCVEICGLPLHEMYWVPMSKAPPMHTKSPEISLLRTRFIGLKKTFLFSLVGSHHMMIILQPLENCSLKSVIFNNEVHQPNITESFTILAKSGTLEQSLIFSVTIESANSENSSKFLFLSITGFQLFKNLKKKSDTFEMYINSYPDYVYVDSKIATYENWIF